MKPLIVSLLVAAGLWAGEGFGQAVDRSHKVI